MSKVGWRPCSLVIVAGLQLAALPVHASDWQVCSSGRDNQRTFDACSAIIDAGTEIPFIVAHAYYTRSTFHHSSGHTDLELKDLDQAIALYPEDGVFYFIRGLTYAQIGNTKKARADYSKALELMPGDKPVMDALARLGQ